MIGLGVVAGATSVAVEFLPLFVQCSCAVFIVLRGNFGSAVSELFLCLSMGAPRPSHQGRSRAGNFEYRHRARLDGS